MIRRGEKDKVRQALQTLIRSAKRLTDEEVAAVFDARLLDRLLEALLDPAEVRNHSSIAEFLRANKWRGTLLARLHTVITRNYSFRGSKDGKTGLVSPYYNQWYDDGVMFMEGDKPFEGFIGLFRDGDVKFAIAARDIRIGDSLDRETFEFISIEEFNLRRRALGPQELERLDAPLLELRQLLDAHVTSEAEYQQLLERYPWILGAQYEEVQRHHELDDRNIPDFTAVRVHDQFRDVLEIKQPFLTLFKKTASPRQSLTMPGIRPNGISISSARKRITYGAAAWHSRLRSASC